MNAAHLTEDDMQILSELELPIQLSRALKSLEELPEFKFLVTHLTETKVLELTYSLSAIDNGVTNTDNVTKQLTAIAFFRQYLDDVKTAGDDAEAERLSILDGANK